MPKDKLPNTLTLTANSRLARSLQNTYHAHHQTLGETVWETPDILPLASWLQQTFHETNQSGQILLTGFQLTRIVEDIIQQKPMPATALQPSQIPKIVAKAWELMQLWQVPLEELKPFDGQKEVQHLILWLTEFEKRCRDHHWITDAELPTYLQQQDARSPLPLPSTLHLIGFDDFNPSLQAFITQLKKRIHVTQPVLKKENAHAQQIILENTQDELVKMAQWARALWEKNPATQIGCVIPDLNHLRTQVIRIFTDIFKNKVFNISAGVSLYQQPMIQTALTVLEWCLKPLPVQTVSHVLQSPFLCANETEKNKGAMIDEKLREKNKLRVSLQDVYHAMPHSRFGQLYKKNTVNTEKKSPSAWTDYFIDLLKTIGWPSSHTQDSESFQLLESFKKMLTTFSALDFIFPQMTQTQALYFLNTLSKETLFQPKSHHESIQIMGVLEASGMLFDNVWVMGMDDRSWPASANPHPFIPHAIQQKYYMPHATSKREFEFCKQMTDRLTKSADTVIFSSPASAGDQLRFPSPLLQSVPIVDITSLTFSREKSVAETSFDARIIEKYNDTPLSVTNFSVIRGGSQILKWQSLCPFRAFATVRLQAHALNTPEIGVSAMQKGIFIHDILYRIWGELKNQQTLNALSEEALHSLVTRTIDVVFSENSIENESPDNYFYDIEKKRLQIIIKKWLDFEKTRPSFSVISREETANITVDRLPLKIRLDRVDQHTDGSFLLIDYKTNKNSTQAWLQERLTDPQLPLYAVFHADKPYQGMSFAEVRSDKMQFNGISNKDRDWNAQLTRWKEALTQLASDFCEGVATVDPTPTACQTCECHGICRINLET